MALYSEVSHWKWWFAIAMLNYQRVHVHVDIFSSDAVPNFTGDVGDLSANKQRQNLVFEQRAGKVFKMQGTYSSTCRPNLRVTMWIRYHQQWVHNGIVRFAPSAVWIITVGMILVVIHIYIYTYTLTYAYIYICIFTHIYTLYKCITRWIQTCLTRCLIRRT